MMVDPPDFVRILKGESIAAAPVHKDETNGVADSSSAHALVLDYAAAMKKGRRKPKQLASQGLASPASPLGQVPGEQNGQEGTIAGYPIQPYSF